MISKRLITL